MLVRTLGLNLLLKVFILAQFNVIQSLINRGVSIGIVEGLWRETAPLGIKTLLFEPGRFRTKLLSSDNMKATTSTIAEYAEFSESLLGQLAKEDRRQPGDPVKLVEIILDIVRQEGIAKGRNIPFRLPLGTDCYTDIKSKCEETLKLLKEWEYTIKSTDYED